jgi:hypothetical protein
MSSHWKLNPNHLKARWKQSNSLFIIFNRLKNYLNLEYEIKKRNGSSS